jgi:hypothetical protein
MNLVSKYTEEIIKSIYLDLRDKGHYDVDWLDRLLWKGFAVFVLILLLV